MGRWLTVAVALGAAACASPPPGPAPLPAVAPRTPPARVVVVTLPGWTGDPAAAPAARPHLAALARAGVRSAELEAGVPASGYPAHATYATGRPARSHGLAGEWLLGDTGVRPVRAAHAGRVAGTPLWTAARAAGLASVALDWPATLGAEIDHLLPDVERPASPSWLAALGSAATPWIRDRLAASPAAEGWPDAAVHDDLLVVLACQAARFPVAPSLWLVRLRGPADAHARSGPASDAARASLDAADRRLGRLLACFREAGLLGSTAWVLLGDAPYRDVHTRVDPNVALRAAGLLTASPDGGVLSWSAIVRSAGSSAFVYARDEGAALDARRALEAAARDGDFRLVSAAELRALGGDPSAWFGLAAAPGVLLGNGVRPPERRVAAVRGAQGALAPAERLALAAWGPGLRAGLRVPRIRSEDVAPTVAALLGLRLRDAEGRAMIGLLDLPGVAPGRRPRPEELRE